MSNVNHSQQSAPPSDTPPPWQSVPQRMIPTAPVCRPPDRTLRPTPLHIDRSFFQPAGGSVPHRVPQMRSLWVRSLPPRVVVRGSVLTEFVMWFPLLSCQRMGGNLSRGSSPTEVLKPSPPEVVGGSCPTEVVICQVKTSGGGQLIPEVSPMPLNIISPLSFVVCQMPLCRSAFFCSALFHKSIFFDGFETYVQFFFLDL